MNKFAVIWAGQLVSVIGSALSAFVIGVWVYLDTGSVTQFVLIEFCAAVPGILASSRILRSDIGVTEWRSRQTPTTTR